MQAGPMDDALLKLKLIVTAGAGGVGKTTMAATIALRAALLGRRVVVLTIDPAQRLAQAMGLEGITGELAQIPIDQAAHPKANPGTLSAMMLDIKTTSDRMVQRFAPSKAASEEILNNHYYGYFSTVLAGTQEYMAVEQVRTLMDDDQFDLIVLDTPPATHALDFLDAPERLMDGLNSLPVKALSMDQGSGLTGRLAQHGKGLVLRGLKRFTGGPFLEDLSVFFSVFGQILGELEASSREVKRVLRSELTRFYLVTTPERSNLDEAIKFRGELRKRGFPLGGFLVNRVHPEFTPFELDEPEFESMTKAVMAITTSPMEHKDIKDGLCSLVNVHREMNAMAERDSAILARLEMAGGIQPVAVPMLIDGLHDLEGLKRLGESLR